MRTRRATPRPSGRSGRGSGWGRSRFARGDRVAQVLFEAGLTAEPHNYFRMSDKAFNDDERRLLGWLGSSEKSMKLCALANWWRGNKVPFNAQNANHFLYA